MSRDYHADLERLHLEGVGLADSELLMLVLVLVLVRHFLVPSDFVAFVSACAFDDMSTPLMP